MSEPATLQARVGQLQEAHLRDHCGTLALQLTRVLAERDAYAEEVARLKAELQTATTTQQQPST